MSNPSKIENDSALILQSYLLDTQIEDPEKILIVDGEKQVLLSELFALFPTMREKKIEERAEIFRQLGWEAPKC